MTYVRMYRTQRICKECRDECHVFGQSTTGVGGVSGYLYQRFFLPIVYLLTWPGSYHVRAGVTEHSFMTGAKNGDTVKVHYKGTLEDGTIFDSSFDREPLEFTIGAGNLIPGFERAVLGMVPEESKTVTIPSDQAYGPYREELVMELGPDKIPTDMELERGQQVQVRQEDGRVYPVMVTEISDSGVTLDANHPLAGRDLTFELQLVEIC